MKRLVPLLTLVAACASVEKKPGVLETPLEVSRVEAAHSEVQPIRARFIKRMRQLENAPWNSAQLDQCRIDSDADFPVGRTSHRVRNPDNAPAAWMVPHLDRYKGKRRSEVPPYVLHEMEDGKVGYLEPLFMEPVCLNCHGPAMRPGLEDAIAERYPKDQATNFENGEFRGFIWAILAAPDSKKP